MKQTFELPPVEEVSKAGLTIGLLQIGAVNFNVLKPYTWASGLSSPAYCNNRLVYSHPDVLDVMRSLYCKKLENKNPTMIIGIPSGGTIIGALVAATLGVKYGVPVLNDDGTLKECIVYDFSKEIFSEKALEDLNEKFYENEAVVNDVALLLDESRAVPYAIYGYINNIPMYYVRKKEKAHGMKQKIEGDSSLWFSKGIYWSTDGYMEEKDSPSFIDRVYSYPINGRGAMLADISGESIICIEDLISTGKSSIKYIKALEEAGGTVTDCLANFSWGFPGVGKKFSDLGVTMDTLIDFEFLCDLAEGENFYTSEEIKELKLWQEDIKGWSETYLQLHKRQS